MKKYLLAIVAGVIGGIILVILSFLGSVVFTLIFPWEMTRLIFAVIINLIGHPNPAMQFSDVILPCVVAFSLVGMGAITFFITGSLAIKMASRYITNILNVIVQGVIAGLTAEIILIPFAVFFKLIALFINPDTILTSDFYGIQIWELVVILPLLFGIIFAVIGASIYNVIAKKRKLSGH